MDHYPDTIPEADFHALRERIAAQCGVTLAPAKRVMIETRLRKRVRALGMPSLTAYCAYVRSSAGQAAEWQNLVNAVTTNKTDFFREPAHFDFLVDRAIPDLLQIEGGGARRPLVGWSAACSSGQEPYTLAMVLADVAESVAPRPLRFRIEASDISTAVLEKAQRGVYAEADVLPVPESIRRRYVMRSKDRSRALVRISPEIRAHVTFRQLNLMDSDYGFADALDFVFCRNVMIYFNKRAQQQVLARICRALRPGGYLMMGHSESLNGLTLPVVQVAPTVYRTCHV